MTDLRFPDISEFQANADIAGIRKHTDALAVRVAYGTRLDKTMPHRRNEVRDEKFVALLWYLFLRASQDIAQQVATVVDVLGPLLPGESIAVDWEADTYSPAPTPAQRDEAAKRFELWSGRPTLIYCSASVNTGISRPVWIAAYQSVEPQTPHVLWQYTNSSPWPGCGSCDTSVFHGTAQLLTHQLKSTEELQPMYNPPIIMEPLVASCVVPDGSGIWGVAASGAVYALPVGKVPFHGAVNGKTYFANRKAVNIQPEIVNEVWTGFYEITASTGEKYVPKEF